ncbi:MAG: extracellular solute-binding protein [Eubacteriales bacterium]|nr:extracellular solute-binding protein [Eubacteriales bacterium]
MNLKKIGAILLTLYVMTTFVAGCANSTNNAQVEVDGETVTVSDSEEPENSVNENEAVISKDMEGHVVIWDWNGEAQKQYIEAFNKIYPNIEIEVQDVSWDDYMTKLQTSYVSGLDLPDIILGEIAWRGTLNELGILENLEQEPYNLDRNQMVASSVPLTSDVNGNIVGVEMQVTPAGFAYKRDLAIEYLGTDDPDEVGEMIKDWDTFLETGLSVLEKSNGKVKMMASMGDMILTTLSQNVVDYVDGNAVDITSKMQMPLEISFKMWDAGIIGNVEMYSADWYAAYASDEYLFYEAAAWCPPYVISVYAAEDEGNWAITMPPNGSFNLGGTTLGINKDSENKLAAWAYLQYIYFSEEGGSIMYDLTGNYTCYAPYYESDNSSLNKEGPYDSFFGGQSLVDFYINQAAPMAKTAVQTRYDAVIDTVFQKLTPVYMLEKMNAEEALEKFKEEVELQDNSLPVK